MEETNNKGKIVGAILIGAIVGGVAGAALGILFAPDNGNATRKKLLVKGRDLAGSIKGMVVDLVEEVKKETASVKEKFGEAIANGNSTIEKLK